MGKKKKYCGTSLLSKKPLFNMDYAKSHLTFQRRWAKDGSSFNQPTSPTAQHLPLPLIPDSNDSTIPSLLRRVFSRSSQPTTVSRIQESPQEFSEESEDVLNLDEKADDVYLKSVKLLLNGSPLQSLSSEDASRNFDYLNYFMFLKTTGCIKTGRLFSSLTPICLNLELPDGMLILLSIFIIIEFLTWYFQIQYKLH